MRGCRAARPGVDRSEAALDVVNAFGTGGGPLKLNVPVVAARLMLPRVVPPFIAAYPEIKLDVVADDSLVDVIAAGCDAGIRYEERLEQDMIAVIGPRLSASPQPVLLHISRGAAGRSIRVIS